MSKCNKCKYEYHPMIATPCAYCREQYGEGSLGYIMFGYKFQPKERAEIKADTENKADMVNHPQHYNRDGAMECMDEMITVFGKDIVACFCLCNTWKYRYRASNKGHEEDLSKSDYYMDKYKELITQRSVLGSESTITLEELKDIVKEKLEKSYTGREIKKNDK